jgi:Male sterility protein
VCQQVGPIEDQPILVRIFGKHVDARAAQQYREEDFPQPGPCTVVSESALFSPEARLSVAKSFKGATVLITGAVGYVGSVVLEQLLRLCPEITRIYLVVRYGTLLCLC